MMTRQILATISLAATATVLVGWLVVAQVSRRSVPRAHPPTPAGAIAPPAMPQLLAPGRKIKAHLFYVSEDGLSLTSVERDVAYGDGTLEQARQIVLAQIAPVADPEASAVPPGTTLRALFLTDRGEAFVDLSRDVVTAHPGGTVNELLTVYTIVDVLTTNLPAVTAVQILVDGKDVETLAGHVDVHRPLAKNLDYVQSTSDVP